MRPIINPYNLEANQCFGCSRSNPIGLKLDFFEEGDEVLCYWSPRSELQGYLNVLHGGIQTTLLDEIASWTVNVKVGPAGFTSSINIQFKKSVYVNRGDLLLKAKYRETIDKIAWIDTSLYDNKNQLCTTAEIGYFVLPEEIARERYWYPGKDAFFHEE